MQGAFDLTLFPMRDVSSMKSSSNIKLSVIWQSRKLYRRNAGVRGPSHTLARCSQRAASGGIGRGLQLQPLHKPVGVGKRIPIRWHPAKSWLVPIRAGRALEIAALGADAMASRSC